MGGCQRGYVTSWFELMDDLNTATADRYRTFADWARDASPLYEEFALGVADDPRVLAFLGTLPVPKRQPNLLFAAVKYLTGVLPDYSSFRSFVNAHEPALRKLMLERSTQTNEPGRCAVILPLLSTLRQPIALLEVGASAGLCLVPDRYGYDYGGHRLGSPDAPVVLSCEPSGPVPLPETLPQIVWRRGIDLNPLDPADPDTAAWLSALVWAGETEREERLRAALAVAASDPPKVVRGDIRNGLDRLARTAPSDATLVVFHSAVLAYLPDEDRSEVVAMMSGLDGVWISSEARGVLPVIDAQVPHGAGGVNGFVLARDGEPVAIADQHGGSLHWLDHTWDGVRGPRAVTGRPTVTGP